MSTIDDDFETHAAGMAAGQRALEAVVFYRACGHPVPEWALEEIESAYENFKTGAPSAGFKRADLGEEAPRSLGEAFGINDHKRLHMRERRVEALMAPIVINLFAEKRYPRTKAGYEAAANALFLTPKQIQLWLDKHGKAGTP